MNLKKENNSHETSIHPRAVLPNIRGRLPCTDNSDIDPYVYCLSHRITVSIQIALIPLICVETYVLSSKVKCDTHLMLFVLLLTSVFFAYLHLITFEYQFQSPDRLLSFSC